MNTDFLNKKGEYKSEAQIVEMLERESYKYVQCIDRGHELQEKLDIASRYDKPIAHIKASIESNERVRKLRQQWFETAREMFTKDSWENIQIKTGIYVDDMLGIDEYA